MAIVQVGIVEYDGVAMMGQTDVVGNLPTIQEQRGAIHQQVGHQYLGRVIHPWNSTTLDDQQAIGRTKEHATVPGDTRSILREGIALRIAREAIGGHKHAIGTDKANALLQGNPQVTGRQLTH